MSSGVPEPSAASESAAEGSTGGDGHRGRWKARREAVHQGDRKAMRAAARQWGALSHAQAVTAGLTPDQVTYRLLTVQWRRVARGVYVIAGAPDRWEQRVMIAVLAGPAGTVASHLTAAALFGLSKPPSIPQVTIRRGSSGRFQGADVFRGSLETGETCVRSKLRCTTPARTIIDCAAPPSSTLRACAISSTARSARSSPDRLGWCRRADGPGRRRPGGGAGIRELKVLFEYDSDEHHGPRCWIADDERKARLEALGWTVVSIDRFDLRPSSTRLRDELERIRLSRLTAPSAVNRDSHGGGCRSAA